MRENALIGYTGFVGSNLSRQYSFEWRYHSKNIQEIAGRSFDFLMIAGVPAVKWWANANPEADWSNIARLLDLLKSVRAERAVLISTVDVYPTPVDVNETSPIFSDESNPVQHYGRHRRRVELELQAHFPDLLTVRLPALFGDGLKKNVIFDLIHDNLLEKINPEGCFQYYFLDHLAGDIQKALDARLTTVNFATEPLSTREILTRFFPEKQVAPPTPLAQGYDFKTLHSSLWGRNDGYLYSREEVLTDLGTYLARTRP